jgi:hypothetical protein
MVVETRRLTAKGNDKEEEEEEEEEEEVNTTGHSHSQKSSERVTNPPQSPLPAQHTTNTRDKTPMPSAGFEPTISEIRLL